MKLQNRSFHRFTIRLALNERKRPQNSRSPVRLLLNISKMNVFLTFQFREIISKENETLLYKFKVIEKLFRKAELPDTDYSTDWTRGFPVPRKLATEKFQQKFPRLTSNFASNVTRLSVRSRKEHGTAEYAFHRCHWISGFSEKKRGREWLPLRLRRCGFRPLRAGLFTAIHGAKVIQSGRYTPRVRGCVSVVIRWIQKTWEANNGGQASAITIAITILNDRCGDVKRFTVKRDLDTSLFTNVLEPSVTRFQPRRRSETQKIGPPRGGLDRIISRKPVGNLRQRNWILGESSVCSQPV